MLQVDPERGQGRTKGCVLSQTVASLAAARVDLSDCGRLAVDFKHAKVGLAATGLDKGTKK